MGFTNVGSGSRRFPISSLENHLQGVNTVRLFLEMNLLKVNRTCIGETHTSLQICTHFSAFLQQDITIFENHIQDILVFRSLAFNL